MQMIYSYLHFLPQILSSTPSNTQKIVILDWCNQTPLVVYRTEIISCLLTFLNQFLSKKKKVIKSVNRIFYFSMTVDWWKNVCI